MADKPNQQVLSMEVASTETSGEWMSEYDDDVTLAEDGNVPMGLVKVSRQKSRFKDDRTGGDRYEFVFTFKALRPYAEEDVRDFEKQGKFGVISNWCSVSQYRPPTTDGKPRMGADGTPIKRANLCILIDSLFGRPLTEVEAEMLNLAALAPSDVNDPPKIKGMVTIIKKDSGKPGFGSFSLPKKGAAPNPEDFFRLVDQEANYAPSPSATTEGISGKTQFSRPAPKRGIPPVETDDDDLNDPFK